jgi:hypothetical protein
MKSKFGALSHLRQSKAPCVMLQKLLFGKTLPFLEMATNSLKREKGIS